MVNVCAQTNDFGSLYYTGVKCNIANVSAGNTIILTAGINTGTVTITSTESFTCPAGAKANDTYLATEACYVVLASSHAQFNIDLSGPVTNPGIVYMIAEEVQGLGAFDSGSAAAASPYPSTVTTVNTTTAATNEWVHAGCVGFAGTPNGVAPGSPFHSIVEGAGGGGTNWMSMTEQYIQPSATTFAASCSYTGGTTRTAISVLAFAQSSPPPVPAINIVQWCISTDTDTAEQCVLSNVTSGNKVVFMEMGQASGTINGNCSRNGTVNSSYCTCPASSQVWSAYTTPNTNNIGIQVCYGDLPASYTTFNPQSTADTRTIIAMEVSGLNSGIDAGSEAAALAQTVNYTTAIANEWTFCAADDIPTSAAAAMLPQNSFNNSGTGVYSNNTRGVGYTNSFGAYKKTVSSGSNTCSYTYSNNLHPQIATASFGFTAAQTSSNHSAIF